MTNPSPLATAALEKAVEHMCDLMDALGTHFPPPRMEANASGTVYRHPENERTAPLACYLKAVKICSTLRAAVILVREGHTTEAYALCRISDEMGEDILFFAKPRGPGGTYTSNQQRALSEFYQEEFDKPEDPLRSKQKRDRVPRQKVYSAIMNREDGFADPSTAVAAFGTLHLGVSGYVHGAYGHIVEIYGGSPPKYHPRGMKGTPVIPVAVKFVSNYILRGSMALEAIAKLTGDEDLVSHTRALSTAIQRTFGIDAGAKSKQAKT